MLEHSQINETRKPHYHKERINRKHDIFVEEATAGFAVVGDGEGWIEEEIGKGKEIYHADSESEKDGSRRVGVDGVRMVP